MKEEDEEEEDLLQQTKPGFGTNKKEGSTHATLSDECKENHVT
jgi:hypothetical protein